MSKIKLLVISDSIQVPSGVGIQCNKLLAGLLKTGQYDIVQIAGSLVPLDPRPFYYNGIKLYNTSDGYGNPALLRAVMKEERPDIVLAFSDPRFFFYLFLMDNEIRTQSKLVFYHTWDNEPFPKFNLPWYSACDEIVLISKFSYDLLSANGVACENIPHGYDPSEFYPLPPEVSNKYRQDILRSANNAAANFIIFWNNRNITRKRPGDVLAIFKEFSRRHPDTMLIVNSTPLDREGTDIVSLWRDFAYTNSPIVFNFQRITSERLNVLYNVADVTLNIAYNEGFGLCVGESLAAGTPVIATHTGGMPEQMSDGQSEFGILLQPDVRELFGVPGAPYIYRDYVSSESVLRALEQAYQETVSGIWKKKYGVPGREHIIQNFHIDSTVKKWHDLLPRVHVTPSTFKPWRMSIH